MSRFKTDLEFNEHVLTTVGVSKNVVNYVKNNADYILDDYLFSEEYKDKSKNKEFEGYTSSQEFDSMLTSLLEAFDDINLQIIYDSYNGYSDKDIELKYDILITNEE